MAETVADGVTAAQAEFDADNAYNSFAFRGMMLWARDVLNTIHADAQIGFASLSEATCISQIKAVIAEDGFPSP